MPQLIFIAALGAGAYAGFRWLKKAADAMSDDMMSNDMRRAEVEVRERRRAGHAKDLGVLEYDPKSGVYRPRARD